MRITFHNDFHGTTATVSARGWQLSHKQLRNLWLKLCGDLTCPCQDWSFGGLYGENKYRLKPITNGAKVIPQGK